ncbi:non-ribosomal peptide synthetase [Saccharothrix australiensis]|uniref:Amino acid adenylation domain-containing protein n=1 Tax=Saccharothrix australiensis TaxID=2072 RepID=A0A495VY46_9PSEU|nr:non-ribosomal peptide synthetase [Saccharothrix australiensis]RKT54246.1 amino acid adenylation domain-containing protein [Saccharothrix australiensis]
MRTGEPTDVRSVVAMFESRVERSPQAVAVVDGEDEWTYGRIAGVADAIAAGLRGHDIGVGDVVGVHLPRSAIGVATAFAVLKVGGVHFPLDTAFPDEYVRSLVTDCAPRAVVTTADLDLHGTVALRVDALATTPVEKAVAPPTPTGDTPAYVVYTSGSTGPPKGVLVPMAALTGYVRWHEENLVCRPGIRVAQTAPVCFDVSLQEIVASLALGKTLVIAPEGLRARPEEFVRWLADHRVGQLLLPNVLLEAVAEAARQLGTTLPDLCDLVQAGEQLTLSPAVRELVTAEPGRALRNSYGASEVQDVTSYLVRADDLSGGGPCPIGSPIGGHGVLVLDEALRETESGELYVTGAVAHGYPGRPALTAARFVADPFAADGSRMYRTGDLVRRDARGDLVFLGRADGLVKVGGVRVAPSEVEAALLAHPEVTRAAVVARARSSGVTTLAAFAVAAGATATALRAHLTAVLPAHAVPAQITVVDTLPLTVTGKVDRAALAAPADAGVRSTGATARELVLLEILAEVLAVPDLGLDDGFIARGGSSLLAITAERAARRKGVRLPAGELLRPRTVGELAALVEFEQGGVPPAAGAAEHDVDPYGLALSADEVEAITRAVHSGQ